MSSVFVDVGAHEGQTLEEVVKDRWPFTQIWAFEPMPAQFNELVRRFGDNPKVVLMPYGLDAASGTRPVYGANADMEASIYPAKVDVDASVVTECRMLEASWFFRPRTADDRIYVKLNCEGAEIPILGNLCDTGEIHKIADVMIDFDIRKVRGSEDEEARVLARLAEVGFTRFSLCDNVMVGATHQERIAHWLEGVL